MTIHAPTYPGDMLTLTADGPLTFPKSERAGWLLTNDPDPAPTYPAPIEVRAETFPLTPAVEARLVAAFGEVPYGRVVDIPDEMFPPAVVDDSPAALIARLTAGDPGDDSR